MNTFLRIFFLIIGFNITNCSTKERRASLRSTSDLSFEAKGKKCKKGEKLCKLPNGKKKCKRKCDNKPDKPDNKPDKPGNKPDKPGNKPDNKPSTPVSGKCLILNEVYFAQTHVLPPSHRYFKLVSERKALLKVQVTKNSKSSDNCTMPAVTAELNLKGRNQIFDLNGPATLPKSFEKAPGKVQHTYDDSFTVMIPAGWIKPGLKVTVKADDTSTTFNNLKIGAPNRFSMTLFDLKFFRDVSKGKFLEGWFEELVAKFPTAGIELRRLPPIILNEVVMLPVDKAHKDKKAPATRITSKDDYLAKNPGVKFDGEQALGRQIVGSPQSSRTC